MKDFNILYFTNVILHIIALSYILGTSGFFTLMLIKVDDKNSFIRFLKSYIDYLPFFFLLFIITNISYIITNKRFSTIFKIDPYVKILVGIYIPFVIISIIVAYHLYNKISKLIKLDLPLLLNKEWWKIKVDISVIMEFYFVILIIEALLIYLIYFK